MRPTVAATILALVAAAPLPAAMVREDGEKQIADLTKNRVAGEPVNCIPQYPNNRSWTIDRVGVVYEVGTTRYVMRFLDGCDQLNRGTYFATNTPTIQICAGDAARVFDNGPPQFFLTSCIFGKFVPYKRQS